MKVMPAAKLLGFGAYYEQVLFKQENFSTWAGARAHLPSQLYTCRSFL